MIDDKRKMEFGEKECPHCKKMLSARPGPYARHVALCDISKMQKSLSGIENEDIKRTMEKALVIQKGMLDAPNLSTIDLSVDINMSLRQRYAPETIESYSPDGRAIHTHTAYFGDAKQQAVDISRGYVPVLNENSEYVVNDGGDILYTRPLEISQRIERMYQEESRARLASVTIQAQTQSSAKDIPTPNVAEGEIKEEELALVGKTPEFAVGEI